MRTFSPVIFLFILAIGLSGCVTHEQSLIESKAKYYDQNDLESLFARDRVAEFKTASGSTGKVTYSQDRKMHVWLGDREDDGSYRIQNDQFCSSWKTLRSGEKCTKFYKIKDNVFDLVTQNGAYDSTVTFIK